MHIGADLKLSIHRKLRNPWVSRAQQHKNGAGRRYIILYTLYNKLAIIAHTQFLHYNAQEH